MLKGGRSKEEGGDLDSSRGKSPWKKTRKTKEVQKVDRGEDGRMLKLVGRPFFLKRSRRRRRSQGEDPYPFNSGRGKGRGVCGAASKGGGRSRTQLPLK